MSKLTEILDVDSVVSFAISFTYINKNQLAYKEMKFEGSSFDNLIKEYLKAFKIDDKIYFDEIISIDKYGNKKRLNAMIYTLKLLC